MKKNEIIKTLVLIVFTLIISLVFINNANAIVMWKKCEYLGSIEKPYDKYKYFAAVTLTTQAIEELDNDTDRGIIPAMIISPKEIWTEKYPVFFIPACWYKDDKYREEIDSCDTPEGIDDENLIADVSVLEGNVCPSYINEIENDGSATLGDFISGAGTEGKASEIETLDTDMWIIYKLKYTEGDSTSDGTIANVIGEGYRSDGYYSWLSTKSVEDILKSKEIIDDNQNEDLVDFERGKYCWDNDHINFTAASQIFRMEEKNKDTQKLGAGKDYFRILTKQEARFTYFFKQFEDKFPGGVTETILYKSNDNSVKKWVSNYMTKIGNEVENLSEQISNLKTIKNNNELNKTAKDVKESISNGSTYTFDGCSGEETCTKLTTTIDQLASSYDKLEKILNSNGNSDVGYSAMDEQCQKKIKDPDITEAAWSEFMCENFNKYSKEALKKNSVDEGVIMSLIYNSIGKEIASATGEDADILMNYQIIAKELLTDYAVLAGYINKNKDIYVEKYGLSNEYVAKIGQLRNSYFDLSRDQKMEIVIDCESLIGDDLIAKIDSVFNIVKIAVPIILIIFGIIDFTKALFSGDDEQMKKAQKTFLKRIIIAVLFFFTQIIVKVILLLANKVWDFINPDICVFK